MIRRRCGFRLADMSEIGQRPGGNAASVTKALDRAVMAVERLAKASVGGPHAGPSAVLLEQLRGLRERAARGETIATEELGGIVRSVSDWLPDEQFPIIGLLGGVVRAAQRAGGTRKRAPR